MLINGLVWCGTKVLWKRKLSKKYGLSFTALNPKIGALIWYWTCLTIYKKALFGSTNWKRHAGAFYHQMHYKNPKKN
jgi:hypothetical protein